MQTQTIQLQQVVIGTGIRGFLEEVNGLLLDGWRVVPGTFNCSTVCEAARPYDSREFVDPAGHTWRQRLFVVIERDEERRVDRNGAYEFAGNGSR
jgi:hypothetical protein